MQRRRFLQAMATGTVALGTGGLLTACRPDVPADFALTTPPFGPLGAPDAHGLRLPAGFTSRVVATSGQPVADTGYTWHTNPDGGACFADVLVGGWIYVSNAESLLDGGASMIRFDAAGTIVDARRILGGTYINCAGGRSATNTWLSCEEYDLARVWECDPAGVAPAVARPAMGRFKHEAAATDSWRKVVYLTEDESDGALYRFTPTSWPDLDAGLLEVLTEKQGGLAWAPVPDPTPTNADVRTRHQVPGTKVFDGGEGACVDHRGALFFTTKGDNRVWAFDPDEMRLEVVYDDSTSPTPDLTGVDNITVDDDLLYVAEDGGNMQIVAVGAGQQAAPMVEVSGVSGSEITGPAFSPDGSRLYFSSQRNPGRTYEVSGPWRTPSPA